jgi:hypothetical protein
MVSNKDVWVWMSVRLPVEMHLELSRNAAELGVSRSDVVRMRLKSGHVPTFPVGAALMALPSHSSALEAARAANHLKV